jgi:hypothetical protein
MERKRNYWYTWLVQTRLNLKTDKPAAIIWQASGHDRFEHHASGHFQRGSAATEQTN